MKFKAVILSILFGSASAYAQDLKTFDEIQARRQTLEARENQIKRNSQNLEVLNQRYGYLVQVQDKIIRGQGGLMERMANWMSKADSILTQFESASALATSLDQSNVTGSIAKIDAALKQIVESMVTLEKEGLTIRQSLTDIKNDLATKDALPVDLKPKYAEFIDALNQQLATNQRVAAQLENRFSEERLVKFRELMTQVNDYLMNRMKKLLLTYPELQGTIEQARANLAFVEILYPVLYALDKDSAVIEDHITNRRVATAESEIANLEKKVGDQIISLKGRNISQQMKSEAEGRLKEVLERVNTKLQESLKKNARYAQFLIFANSERNLLSADCRDSKRRVFRDCEVLRVLNQVKLVPADVKYWSTEDMAFFEKQLILVRKGPGLVSGGQAK
jgi:hypothetical protein